MSAWQALLAIAIGLPLLVALMELLARWLVRQRGGYYVWEPHRRVRMEVDRDTLPSLQPVVHHEYNRDGERGDQTPRSWDDTHRVLVAGGSAAEGYFLDQPDTWPAVVQELLSRPAHLEKLGASAVHVGSIARSLASCEYIGLMFERVLPRYPRLDLVLLMVGASDVVWWLEQGTPDHIRDDRLPASYVFDQHPEGPFGWTRTTLALRRLASHLNRRLRRPVQVRRGAGRRLAEARAMRDRARTILDAVPDPAPLLDYFARHFRPLLEQAKAHASRVVVVRQPWFEKEHTPEEKAVFWNFGQGRPYQEEVTTYYTHRVVCELMSEVDAVASRLAEEVGVEQIDLMPILPRDLTTYYDFLHFGPVGARMVGEAVTSYLLGSPGEPPPGTASAAPR